MYISGRYLKTWSDYPSKDLFGATQPICSSCRKGSWLHQPKLIVHVLGVS